MSSPNTIVACPVCQESVVVRGAVGEFQDGKQRSLYLNPEAVSTQYVETDSPWLVRLARTYSEHFCDPETLRAFYEAKQLEQEEFRRYCEESGYLTYKELERVFAEAGGALSVQCPNPDCGAAAGIPCLNLARVKHGFEEPTIHPHSYRAEAAAKELGYSEFHDETYRRTLYRKKKS